MRPLAHPDSTGRARSRARRLATVVLALWLNACFSWRPLELAPTRTFRETEEVRVQRADDHVTTLVNVRLLADSLVGRSKRTSARVAIPLTEVRQVETLRLQKAPTIAGIVLVVGALAAVVIDGLNHMTFGGPIS